MKQAQNTPRKHLLTSALLLALAQTATAQTADTGQQKPADNTTQTSETTELDAVVVTGIRASLESSMNLKRDAQGIVDGIVAEDIGKFPDTNLAESMQRISGVSIDRQNGEGSKITVRGVGPDFNLVLLNGRQMPASTLLDTGASSSRSFDFANLASEAISQLQVYKTGRVDKPTGGMGATVNIMTTRPLDNPGTHANIGVKGVLDSTNGNLPKSMQGDDLTPEVSGIFSTTSADGRFGVAVTGSYQKRDFGYSQVGVTSGWHNFKGDEVNWGSIPLAGADGSDRITNRPGDDDIYSTPQNLNYSVNGVQRERTNGQLTLQWKPLDNVTTTLDYTYAQNKIEQKRNEMSVWFNYGPSASAWTDGPIAGPTNYTEYLTCSNGTSSTFTTTGVCPAGYAPGYTDLAMGGSLNKTKTELKSLGFNVKWDVTDNFHLGLDYHDSTSESGADSPYGSNNALGTAAFVRGTTSVDFSGRFPVLNVQLPPGMEQISAADMLVTGSAFRNSYMKSEVKQFQLSGDFEFQDYSRLDFGVASTEVENRSAYGFVQADTWGGVGTPADYDDSLWTLDHMGRYFSNFIGHDSADFTDAFFVWDFDKVRQAAIDYTGNAALYTAPAEFSTDRRTTEKSRSAYLQWSNTFDWSIPVSVAAGVRYEKTKVESAALVPTYNAVSWNSNNELYLTGEGSDFTHLSGDYQYWLPALDVSADLTDTVKLRGSYSHTLGRPGWDQIQGGQTLSNFVRVDGGTGDQGNPGLKPLLSHNIDFSVEWYFKEGSYASVGYFRKNIDNYIGTTQVVDASFGLHTPIGGAYWNEAVGAGCASTDVTCIRDYIFANHDGDPGVTRGEDANGHATGSIVGQPGDPETSFRISQPVNQRSASLDGWEFNLQTMFGDTGFGASVNYTVVNSGLTYDDYVIGEQFALVGLSNSANIVGFYDKNNWQVRVAYNWRDKFLSGMYDGTGANPNYTEPYGQLDLSIGYQLNDHWTFSLEGINVTDESLRIRGRHANDLLYLTQNGPRYMFGARYKF
ncbi:MAG: TonB-dependent receptor [Pseudoxanthomonas sp.]